jgi:hypothetical protein
MILSKPKKENLLHIAGVTPTVSKRDPRLTVERFPEHVIAGREWRIEKNILVRRPSGHQCDVVDRVLWRNVPDTEQSETRLQNGRETMIPGQCRGHLSGTEGKLLLMWSHSLKYDRFYCFSESGDLFEIARRMASLDIPSYKTRNQHPQPTRCEIIEYLDQWAFSSIDC